MSRPRSKEVQELAAALNGLDMPDLQKEALPARYITYVDWLERAATGSRRGHYLMRVDGRRRWCDRDLDVQR